MDKRKVRRFSLSLQRVDSVCNSILKFGWTDISPVAAAKRDECEQNSWDKSVELFNRTLCYSPFTLKDVFLKTEDIFNLLDVVGLTEVERAHHCTFITGQKE